MDLAVRSAMDSAVRAAMDLDGQFERDLAVRSTMDIGFRFATDFLERGLRLESLYLQFPIP